MISTVSVLGLRPLTKLDIGSCTNANHGQVAFHLRPRPWRLWLWLPIHAGRRLSGFLASHAVTAVNSYVWTCAGVSFGLDSLQLSLQKVGASANIARVLRHADFNRRWGDL